jgi:hypothetical protein
VDKDWRLITGSAVFGLVVAALIFLYLSHSGEFDANLEMCGVEVWRGGLGGAYLLPTLSSVGASLAPPCFRFHTPLIEPDVRICRIRLSEKTHAIAKAIACDAVCNF